MLLNCSEGTKTDFRQGIKRGLMHNSANEHAVQNPLHRPTYTYPVSDTHTKSIHTHTHTHTQRHTRNTGYCNWNKVQWNYDLTPSWPVTLPLLHLDSFFFFPLRLFSICLDSGFLLPGLTHTHTNTQTHTHKQTYLHKRTHFFTIFSFSSTSFRLQR